MMQQYPLLSLLESDENPLSVIDVNFCNMSLTINGVLDDQVKTYTGTKANMRKELSEAGLEMINALEKYLSATSVDYKIEIFPKTHHGFAFPNRGQLYNRKHAETHWFRILDLFSRKLK